MRNPLTFILAALGLWTLCGSPGALAAGTPAGSTLENQAAANFTDPDAGVQSVLSNKVITTLSAVCAVSVSPKDQLSSYQSGGTVLYSFKTPLPPPFPEFIRTLPRWGSRVPTTF